MTVPDEDDPEALTRQGTSQSSIARPKTIWKEIPFVSVVCMAQFMTQSGLALSIPPVYLIGSSFGTSVAGELSWFTAAYS